MMPQSSDKGIVGATAGVMRAAGSRDPFLALLIIGMMAVLAFLLWKQDEKDEKFLKIQTEMMLDQQKKTMEIIKLSKATEEMSEVSKKTALHLEKLVGLTVKKFETDQIRADRILKQFEKGRETFERGNKNLRELSEKLIDK